MIKVVLDVNVLISALFWKGAPHQVFRKLLKGEFLSFISPQILDELKEKFLMKFRLPPDRVKEFLEIIVFSSQIIEPKKRLKIIKQDPSDNKIIECAVEAGASFIITGDKHLLNIKEYAGIKIVSPRDFLSRP